MDTKKIAIVMMVGIMTGHGHKKFCIPNFSLIVMLIGSTMYVLTFSYLQRRVEVNPTRTGTTTRNMPKNI